jgi:biopolymer transport protein ExbB/TolQ
VPWWTWLSLGIFLLALVAAAVFTVFAFGRLKRHSAALEAMQAKLDELAAASQELEQKQARNQEHMAQFQRRRAGAEASLGQLKYLTSTLSEALGGPRRARGRYLGK